VDDKSESIASDSSAVTPPPVTLKKTTSEGPSKSSRGWPENTQTVHVLPSKKKNGAMKKCRVCAKHKIRKETSIMCLNCGVALQNFMFQCLPHEKLLKRYEKIFCALNNVFILVLENFDF
jgi:hypothetical protein